MLISNILIFNLAFSGNGKKALYSIKALLLRHESNSSQETRGQSTFQVRKSGYSNPFLTRTLTNGSHFQKWPPFCFQQVARVPTMFFMFTDTYWTFLDKCHNFSRKIPRDPFYGHWLGLQKFLIGSCTCRMCFRLVPRSMSWMTLLELL